MIVNCLGCTQIVCIFESKIAYINCNDFKKNLYDDVWIEIYTILIIEKG